MTNFCTYSEFQWVNDVIISWWRHKYQFFKHSKPRLAIPQIHRLAKLSSFLAIFRISDVTTSCEYSFNMYVIYSTHLITVTPIQKRVIKTEVDNDTCKSSYVTHLMVKFCPNIFRNLVKSLKSINMKQTRAVVMNRALIWEITIINLVELCRFDRFQDG